MLDVSLKQLAYVEAAGRLGSIANASTALQISESSVSAAIDGLETRLGFDLFVRVPAKGISKTPVGEEALALISRFLKDARATRAELGSLGGLAQGLVQVACFATAAANFLPDLLIKYAKDYPGVEVNLAEGDIELAVEHLDQGRADVAFTYQDVIPDTQEFRPLVEAPPYALISRSNPLSEAPDVTLEELSKFGMIALTLRQTHDYYTGMFTKAGLQVRVVHATPSTEMIRPLVAAGLGFTILNALPPNYLPDDPRFRAVPLRNGPAPRIFGIAMMKGVRQTRATDAFLKTVEDFRDNGGFQALAILNPKN